MRCENATARQLAIRSARLDPARTSTAFSLPAPAEVELAPEEPAEIVVEYCADRGRDRGVLILETDFPAPGLATVEVPLRGAGGGPNLILRPERLSFGPVAVGAPARLSLTLLNGGDEPLRLRAVRGPPELMITGDATAPLAVDEARSFAVDLTLAVPGPFRGALEIESDDPDLALARVEIEAEGMALPPCEYEVRPRALDFGRVEVFRRGLRSFELENRGRGACILSSARIGGDPAFSIPSAPRGLLVAAGTSTLLSVEYSPLAAGTSSATLELSVSSAAAPRAEVALSGEGAETGILVSPGAIDFGVIGLGCRALPRPLTIYNVGTEPVLITDIALAAPANPAFSLGELPTFTATVAPGGRVELEVGFRADRSAGYAGAVEIVTGTVAPRSTFVGLSGRGDANARQVDEFEQLGEPLVDILWVIDDSCSMAEEQTSLAANFLSFMRFANAQRLAYHMAITTTDVSGGENGRFVPLGDVSRRIVTPNTRPDPVSVFTSNARVGTAGSGSERGLEAAYRALSNPLIGGHNAGFLRPEAALSIVIVSDEEDSSPSTVDFYTQFFQSLKSARDAHAVSVSAIVGDEPSGCRGPGGGASAGLRYLEVAARTGGVFQSICTSDWARSLEDVSITAFGFKRRFVLTNQPVPNTLRVLIDGVEAPALDAEGAARWVYDPDANAIAFSPYAIPEPGSQIQISYVAVCR